MSHYYCVECNHPVSICKCKFPLVSSFEELIADNVKLQSQVKVAREALEKISWNNGDLMPLEKARDIAQLALKSLEAKS